MLWDSPDQHRSDHRCVEPLAGAGHSRSSAVSVERTVLSSRLPRNSCYSNCLGTRIRVCAPLRRSSAARQCDAQIVLVDVVSLGAINSALIATDFVIVSAAVSPGVADHRPALGGGDRIGQRGGTTGSLPTLPAGEMRPVGSHSAARRAAEAVEPHDGWAKQMPPRRASWETDQDRANRTQTGHSNRAHYRSLVLLRKRVSRSSHGSGGRRHRCGSRPRRVPRLQDGERDPAPSSTQNDFAASA